MKNMLLSVDADHTDTNFNTISIGTPSFELTNLLHTQEHRCIASSEQYYNACEPLKIVNCRQRRVNTPPQQTADFDAHISLFCLLYGQHLPRSVTFCLAPLELYRGLVVSPRLATMEGACGRKQTCFMSKHCKCYRRHNATAVLQTCSALPQQTNIAGFADRQLSIYVRTAYAAVAQIGSSLDKHNGDTKGKIK